jgi:protein-arginine kinase activator protein McsA
MNAFDDQEFIAKLEELKEKDIDGFMSLVLLSLKTHPDTAVQANTPIEHKVTAMKRVLKHFEEREDYEDCAFLRDLQKRIEDAEKRQVSCNE